MKTYSRMKWITWTLLLLNTGNELKRHRQYCAQFTEQKQRNTKAQHMRLKRWATPQTRGEPIFPKAKQFLFLIRHRITHIVMCGKSLADDRGKKTSTIKGNNPLSFEIWIFRSEQPVRDDERMLFVAVMSA
jgi:hypothetical protein